MGMKFDGAYEVFHIVSRNSDDRDYDSETGHQGQSQEDFAALNTYCTIHNSYAVVKVLTDYQGRSHTCTCTWSIRPVVASVT